MTSKPFFELQLSCVDRLLPKMVSVQNRPVQNRPFITDHSKQITFTTDPFITDQYIIDHIHNRLCSYLGLDRVKCVRQNALDF